MDPITTIKLAMSAWKSGGTILEFIKNVREDVARNRAETPEETAEFDKAIAEMDTTPWGKPEVPSDG